MRYFILILFILSCESKQVREIGELATKSYSSKSNDSNERNRENHLDEILCYKLLEKYPSSLDSISMLTKIWINADDSCICTLINRIALSYLKTERVEFLICLDSISSHSDGYISEEIEYYLLEILKTKNKTFLQYLYQNQYQTKLASYLYYYLKYDFLSHNKSSNKNIDQLKIFLKNTFKRLPDNKYKNNFINYIVDQYRNEKG